MLLQDKLRIVDYVKAAYNCGAHARALQSYEIYLVRKKGQGYNPATAQTVKFSSEEIT